MNKPVSIQKSLVIFGIPLLIIATMVLLASSTLFTMNANKLSLAITVDLLLITPFIYFLFIRKTAIPKTTVIPFIVIGVVVCSFILPAENQHYLNFFKTWALPIIELAVFSFVVYNIVKAVRLYKLSNTDGDLDVFTTLKSTCYNILPKAFVIPVVTEIAVIYYGFINWKKRKLKPNEFSYHKDSGTLGLLIALVFLIAIETVAIHLLLAQLNVTAAWVLTSLSIYSAIQILGFLKSMTKRPIIIGDSILYLRYGIMNETTINIKDIESIKISSKDTGLNKTTRKLSFLGDLESHNIVIELKKENILSGLYGIKRPFSVLAFYVDKKVEFKNRIEQLLKTENENETVN